MQPRDGGVIAAFDFNGTFTYTDVTGATATATAITTSYQAGQVTPGIGRSSRALLTVHATMGNGGVTKYTLYARITRADKNNPAWKPTEIMLERLDGSGVAVAQEIVAADLVGKDGEDCYVAFVTTSQILSGTLEVMVKADHAPAAGDRLLLAIDVG